MQPLSPITKKNNTTLVDTFRSRDIIQLYREQVGIDTAHFFPTSEFNIFRCGDTGYRFYYPEGMDGDGKFYAALQEKLGGDYYHAWKFENQMALDAISPRDRVLDIGCGTGNFLTRAKEKALAVTGLELNQKAVETCRQKGLEVHNEMIQVHAATHEGAYDVVCMFQVLEHIYDVKSFLEAALKVLKKGGCLVIGVPNNEPYFLGYDRYCTLNLPPHHMGLWNKEVFERLSGQFDLALEEVRYDCKGRVLAEAYVRAKYLAGIRSLPGQHSTAEKLKIAGYALYTVPLTLFKKITKGINGSHIAVRFRKK